MVVEDVSNTTGDDNTGVDTTGSWLKKSICGSDGFFSFFDMEENMNPASRRAQIARARARAR